MYGRLFWKWCQRLTGTRMCRSNFTACCTHVTHECLRPFVCPCIYVTQEYWRQCSVQGTYQHFQRLPVAADSVSVGNTYRYVKDTANRSHRTGIFECSPYFEVHLSTRGKPFRLLLPLPFLPASIMPGGGRSGGLFDVACGCVTQKHGKPADRRKVHARFRILSIHPNVMCKITMIVDTTFDKSICAVNFSLITCNTLTGDQYSTQDFRLRIILVGMNEQNDNR